MKTVYPSAFVFRQEKNIPGNYDRKKYEKFQLTVESNVGDGVSEGEGDGEKRCKHLSASSLIKRRKQFHQNIIQIVRNHHKVRETRVPRCLSSSLSQVSDFPVFLSPQDFLASLNPPLVIPDAKVLRWHPAFSLDAIPEVVESELPKPPVAGEKGQYFSLEYLSQALPQH